MGYQRMPWADALSFLSATPARPGVLSVVRQDGRPHAAPIWYALDDSGQVFFNTAIDTVKGRILRRTGYATLTVQDDQAPYSYVTVEGSVTISEDLDEVRDWAGRIGGRYMGADRADEFAQRNGVPGEMLIRLTVDQFNGVCCATPVSHWPIINIMTFYPKVTWPDA